MVALRSDQIVLVGLEEAEVDEPQGVDIDFYETVAKPFFAR
jgi:hypothetical protein